MKISTYSLLLLIALSVFAQNIDSELATKAAELYLENPILVETISNNTADLAQVFVGEKQGYVVVPLFRKMRPILAHSQNSQYRANHPDNVLRKIILADLSEKFEVQYPQNLINKNNELWDAISTGSSLARILDYEQYGPWLDVNWGQGTPYNTYCPMDPETGERAVTGCVMTAAAMNLYYWQFPYSIELYSSDSYYSYGTTPSIFVEAPPLSMDTVRYGQAHTATMANDEIARLMAALGVIIQASYGSDGTSADISDYQYEELLGFDNARDTSPLSPSLFADMADNAMRGIPIQISMYEMGVVGHSVNLDGWNTSEEYHMNMGWDGYENGWYHLETDLPSTFDWITRTTVDIIPPAHADVSDDCSDPKDITVRNIRNCTLNGLTSDSDVDWYRFRANIDSTYTFYSTGPLDTWCEIMDDCGDDVIWTCEDGGDLGNFYYTFRPNRTGLHYIKIGGHDPDEQVNYRLWYYKTVAPPRPFVQILYPNGNSMYEGEDEISIYFTRGGEPAIEYAKLEYSVTGRSGEWHTIADSLLINNYRWTIPTLSEDAWHCWLRISDSNDSTVRDYIDDSFVVRGPESIDDKILPETMTLRAYPNPFNGIVKIDIPNIHQGKKIEIRDIKGVLISELYNSTWTPEENTSSGIYTISIQGTNLNTKVLYSK